MTSNVFVRPMIAAFLVGLAATVAGQGVRPPEARPEEAPAPQSSKAGASLKVTLLISRYQGEKRTASLPFTLWVTAGDSRPTSLRMAAEVPVPTGVITPSGGPVGYNYRGIGTSIDCTAGVLDDGRVRLNLTVQDSQVFSDATAQQGSPMRGLPSYQNFTSTTQLILKDGQTVQYTTATDKASGEVVKIDATLTVVK